MRILGIETSCDETAAAVIEDGRLVRSNIVATQIEMHATYGGIVPEIASRQHMKTIIPVVEDALHQAGVGLQELDGVAVTHGPGLAGSLLVGVNAAKGLAVTHDLPFIGVNHLEGHIYAAWLEEGVDPAATPGFPLMCLIASGGHTDLILMRGHGDYELVARTRDDAAGEAFDKAARVLGLAFPGGPEIQRAAESGTGAEPKLPRPSIKGSLDFSFSGIKTALLHRARERGVYPPHEGVVPNQDLVREMAAAFQTSVAEVMTVKTVNAARRHSVRGILLGGGVAANSRLREMLQEMAPVPLYLPPPALCTDNGAMIAHAGCLRLLAGEREPLEVKVRARWPLAELNAVASQQRCG